MKPLKPVSLFFGRPDHLLIACFPKSGSTYLHAALQAITGLRDGCISELGHQNEGDICERRLRRLRRRSVIQQHLKATETNLRWMIKYGVRPIVQTRSLFDVVISLHDHFERERTGLPCGVVCQEFWGLSWNERIDYLIQLHLPWYINFLLSWREAARQIAVVPITYEELFADKVACLARVLEFFEIAVTRAEIEAGIVQAERGQTRLNVGVAGRGMRYLTQRHREAICDLAAAGDFQLSASGCVSEMIGKPCAEPQATTIWLRRAA